MKKINKSHINIKGRISKKSLLYINILFITFTILEVKAISLSIFPNNSLNLNLSEIDTSYEVEKREQKNTNNNVNNNSNNNNNSNIVNISNSDDNKWNWPASLSYYISSSYNYGHPAIDIVPTNGDYNIYAAYSGVIVTNSYKWDGGNYLVLKQDNGYYSMYCHLSKKLVSEGTRVEKGQLIGIMGRTGLATGIHLHYSIWNGYPYRHSSSINPFNFY